MSKTNKQKILDVAQDLIQKFGVNGMSYNTISEIVGIRKASIHYHFATKDILIEELLQRYSHSFFTTINAIASSSINAKEKLDEYISLFDSTLSKGDQKICLCGMLGAELATLKMPSVEIVREFYRKNEEILTNILQQGQQEQTLSFAGSAQHTAALIFSLLEGAMLTARALGDPQHFQIIVLQLNKLLTI